MPSIMPGASSPVAADDLIEINSHAVLTHVLVLLQQEQRVAYRILKRRLQLDDETLEDLKACLPVASSHRPRTLGSTMGL